MTNSRLPCPVTLTGRGVGSHLRGTTGTALAYFRDTEGDSWAVVEMDGPSLVIIHQDYIREEREES